MPELKPIHAVLILAIIAIVALYVLGVGFGATSEPPDRVKPMETAQQLRARFLKPRPVTAKELATNCIFSNGVLTVQRGASCQVDVKASDTRVRSLELAFPSGTVVKVEVEPRAKRSVPATFDPLKESRKLDVTEEGADLEVTCLMSTQTQACALRLLPQES
ncbi:hypothetical protein [Pyxidicoccus xibeiensis]|uniref:hypothetical protein n=1 Tax=Pyxidicoccus xibeiensis TaxID=2906759 RepID=UPI0020A71010|nr:hypothetical protein [Pyxidicoccus xibeiensis]MCP3141702.1 hypothetical protein [Pyxidicoccus xibeiensis]